MRTIMKDISDLLRKKPILKRDMYGDPVYPLGDSGFGASITFYRDEKGKEPCITLFHDSDGFHPLGSVVLNGGAMGVNNQFRGRIADVLEALECSL